jgi:hypothetical protein
MKYPMKQVMYHQVPQQHHLNPCNIYQMQINTVTTVTQNQVKKNRNMMNNKRKKSSKQLRQQQPPQQQQRRYGVSLS